MLTVRASGAQTTALSNLARAGGSLGGTTLKLSTGLRINSGRDDPAGLIAAERLRGDLLDLGARQRSLTSRRAQVSVQQSGRQLAVGVLQELRGLVVEAASETASPEQRAALQKEVESSLDGLGHLAKTTDIGAPTRLDSLRQGGVGNVVDGDPAAARAVLDEQISKLTTASAAAGAYEKYTLDVEQRLAEDQAVITAQSLSEIADADYANESSRLTRDQLTYRASLRTVGLLNRIRREGILSLLGTR